MKVRTTSKPLNRKQTVLNLRIDEIEIIDVQARIFSWMDKARGRCVYLANVHSCMEAYDDPKFCQILNAGDLVLPDGRPLMWAAKLLGAQSVSHIRGNDLMLSLFKMAQQHKIPIAFFGGSQTTLNTLCNKLRADFPDIPIACAIAPPFRPLSPEEDSAFIREINESGAQLLFVFLGCPKQERWMAEHRERVPFSCTMVGLGAALDFYTGKKIEAPLFMQRCGLEWLFRLINEPRRLWKRYVRNNPRFIYYFILQWLKSYKNISSGQGDFENASSD